MAIKVTAKITGGAKLNKLLRSLPSNLQRQVKEAVRREAMKLTIAVRATAPVKTGSLKGAIRARFSKGGLRARVGIFGVSRTRVNNLAVKIMRRSEKEALKKKGTSTIRKRVVVRQATQQLRSPFYARFVEFGTKKMKKKPYLLPTYKARRRAIYVEIADAASAAIKKAAK